MPIAYKIDIVEALKEKGFSSYRIRKEKLLSESTLQALRKGDLISLENLGRICEMLGCQPSDLIEYVKDPTEEE